MAGLDSRQVKKSGKRSGKVVMCFVDLIQNLIKMIHIVVLSKVLLVSKQATAGHAQMLSGCLNLINAMDIVTTTTKDLLHVQTEKTTPADF